MSIVSYKGHNYKLLRRGKTKHGERAHLQFTDGSKDFWVDASQIGPATGPTCDNCGRPGGIYKRTDCNGIEGRVCEVCRRSRREYLSFG